MNAKEIWRKKPHKKAIVITAAVLLLIVAIAAVLLWWNSPEQREIRSIQKEKELIELSLPLITQKAMEFVGYEKLNIDLECVDATRHSTLDCVDCEYVFYSDKFAELSNEEKDRVFLRLTQPTYVFADGSKHSFVHSSDITIISGKTKYCMDFLDDDNYYVTYIMAYDENGNGEEIYRKNFGAKHSSNGSGQGTGRITSPACGGTGYVRYNYGDSDLEALLTGHDSYTLGKCTSCNGTGKVSK